jgi:protein TonB
MRPLTDRIAIDPVPGDVPDSYSAKPLIAEEDESVPDLPIEVMNRQDRAAQHRSASLIAKTSSRPVQSVLARGRAANEPVSAAATVKSSLAAKVQPLLVGSLSAAPVGPETQLAPPVISTSNLPTDSPPVALREIKGPAPPPKPGAVPASMTAAVAIVADPYPSLRIPDGGLPKKDRQATSLQLGHLLSRVEPIYPEAARQQGIQGTVKLHAIIGRQGSVENLQPVDGSPELLGAAMNAVRQWRYSETLLAGRSVETEEDIAITFRLSNPTSPAN